MIDRPPDFLTTILTRGRPRLLTHEELSAELQQAPPSPAGSTAEGKGSVQRSIAYGHYFPKGERRIGGSYQEAEIIVSSRRPTHEVSFLTHKRDVPFELRRRPTFVSHTT